ncbi:MAG TPA: hypothetical protein VNP04_21505 [Alphaproteobacteria bacterium]|nr:hypothetical protein [Alphaproteobacteria bacterium]
MVEIDLAKPVMAALQEQDWTIYQEVQMHSYGRIADIVAVRGRLVYVIEVKASFGLTVIEQAWTWRQYAHYVSIAVPRLSNRGGGLGRYLLRHLGVGYLTTHDGREVIPPRLNRTARAQCLRDALVPQQQVWAEAGNAQGRRWTPFQQTCEVVRQTVAMHPGITMKALIDQVKTHYQTPATARSALVKWIELGRVQGVRLERVGRRIYLFPKEP